MLTGYSSFYPEHSLTFNTLRSLFTIYLYVGTDQTYQRLDLGAHGTAFKVVPMYNERRGNFKGCWYRNGTKTIPIIPQPILPNIEEFEVMKKYVLVHAKDA